MNFLKLQTGDYLLLQTGDKLILADGVVPTPTPEAGGVSVYAAVQSRRLKLQRQIEAAILAFLASR